MWLDHSNETSSAVLSHCTIYLVCRVLTSNSVDKLLWCDYSWQMKLSRGDISFTEIKLYKMKFGFFFVNFDFGHLFSERVLIALF